MFKNKTFCTTLTYNIDAPTTSVNYSAWTDPLTCLIYYIVVFGGGFNPPAMSDGSIVAAGYCGPRQSRDSMHCQKGN